MLDINWTFLVLVVNFFILIVILNKILFKPLLNLFKEREDTVKGSLDDAKNIANRREESITNLNKSFAEARNRAKEIFDTFRAEGLQKQRDVVTKADAEASELLEKAKADLRSEAERARKALRAEVDKFSDEIVRKLVKV
ncbi:MAG: ATP synthase F0 subunit B [Nitrospirota bacterium]|nr:ATP synthase F0 subunit B [Nitrospirota bacterium]MDH5767352.1 ATP synthase F0 subunit B [Nitrospirota bacterium]